MMYSLWSPIIFFTRKGLIMKRKQVMGKVSPVEFSQTSSVEDSHHSGHLTNRHLGQ